MDKHLRLAIFITLLSSSSAGATTIDNNEENDARFDFSITSESLSSALLELAEQVNKPLFLRYSLVEGKQVKPLEGNYNIQEALIELLRGTGLEGNISREGNLKIQRKNGYLNTDYEPSPTLEKVESIEELIVTGIRYSLLSSLSLKRNSLRVKEVITEQDLGKLPDGNLTDSLQRLNGVQIERRNGDGTKARIRGFENNVTLYNGELFLTGLEYFQLGLEEQNYENSLETVPIELLRRIEVYKSTRASDIEGAVGGTIDLIGRSAFDVKDYLFTSELKLDRGRYSQDLGPELFTGIGKNWNDELAVLATFNASERTMHMDLAENYVDAGGGREVKQPTIRRFWEDDTSFDYITPLYTKLSDIEQVRQQWGSSINIGWQPNEDIEIEFEWLGIYSQLKQRNYELYHEVPSDGRGEDISFNRDHSLAYLTALSYQANGQQIRTIGETFDTRASNLSLRLSADLNDHVTLKTKISSSSSFFEQALGNADLRNIYHAQELPFWVGDTPISFFGGQFISPTGWVDMEDVCEPCQQGENFDFPAVYRIDSPTLVSQDNADYLNDTQTIFGAYSRARSVDTEQDAWAVRNDLSISITEQHSLNIGMRTDWRSTDFTQYRYLTNLAETAGAARPNRFDQDGNIVAATDFDPLRPSDSYNVGINLPYFSDLCGNGGLRSGEECDIDGDGYSDNLPFGPWVYELDAVNNSIYRFNTGLSFYDTALYDADLDSGFPGFIPWRTYSAFREDFVDLEDFYPSNDNAFGSVTFVDGEKIYDDVRGWIDSMAPNSPLRKAHVPHQSWSVVQKTHAIYGEWNYEGDQVPVSINIGARVVNTVYDITKHVVQDGTGISDTPEEWFVSGVGTGWAPKEVKRSYWSVLPSGNIVWKFHDDASLRFAAGKNILRPNFQDLGRGDSPSYQFDFYQEGDLFFPFLRAETLSTGNPKLEPVEISQADISLEYYINESDFLQFALFYKDIESRPVLKTTEALIPDESPEGATQGELTQPVNEDGSYAKGVELTAQKMWSSGFGVSVNLSYLDGKSAFSSWSKEEYGLPGVSDKSATGVVFYERSQWSIRAAYTWRSEFLAPYNTVFQSGFDIETESFIDLAQVYDSYGQWDARIQYLFNEHLSFYLDAFNLTENQQRSYLEYSGNTMSRTHWEPRWQMGIKFEY